MHLKLSDLSLELNLSLEWSTKLRGERGEGELLLLCFCEEGKKRSVLFCSR